VSGRGHVPGSVAAAIRSRKALRVDAAPSQHKTDHRRLGTRQVNESSSAAAAAHGVQHRPGASVVARLHVVVHRPVARRPVEHQTAQRARAAEIEHDPLRAVSRAVPAAAFLRERGRRRGRREAREQLALGRLPASRRRRGHARTNAVRDGRRERREGEIVERDPPAPSLPRRDRDLQRGDPSRRAATKRSPCEGQIGRPETEPRPSRRDVQLGPTQPPHVLSGGVHELELERIGLRFTAHPQRDGVMRRKGRQHERPPRHRVARMPLIIEVEAQRARPARDTRIGSKIQPHAVRRHRMEGGGIVERLEHPRSAHLGGERRRGPSARGHCTQHTRQPATSHFTLPSVTPST
jgi:hypothetical protein